MTNVTVPIKEDETPNNFGWLMMDKKPIRELQTLTLENPIAMATLLFMINNMSRSNALMISQQGIAKQLKVTSRSIRSAVAVLEAQNYIQIVKIGTANAYVVNTKVAWQGNRGARFAHFHAEVLAYEDEQPMNFIENATPLKTVPQLMDNERLYVQNNEIDPPDQHELDLP